MTRLATIALIPILAQLLGASFALAQRPNLMILSGKVVKSQNDSITVSDGETSLTAEVDEETKVTVNGERAPLKDISVGATATVLVNVETGIVIRVTAKAPVEKEGIPSIAPAIVTRIHPSNPVTARQRANTAWFTGKPLPEYARPKAETFRAVDSKLKAIETEYDVVKGVTTHTAPPIFVYWDAKSKTALVMTACAFVPDDTAAPLSLSIVLIGLSDSGRLFAGDRNLRVTLPSSSVRLTFKAASYEGEEKAGRTDYKGETLTFILSPEEFKSVFHSADASFRLGKLDFYPSKRETQCFAGVYDEMMKTLGAQAMSVDIGAPEGEVGKVKPTEKTGRRQ